MAAPATLAEAGIKLPRASVGWHGTSCPECARQKVRPRDDALGVEIMTDGGARWSCRRCAWCGWLALFTCEACAWQSYRHERSCGACGWEPGKATARHQENPRGRDRPRPQPPAPEPTPRPGGFPAAATTLWRSCQPIVPGTVAAAYLVRRGCTLPHPEGDLRWHPALRHPSGHVGPALVALVTDAVTIEPMTLHRTWLAPDGSGKAEIDKPRLLWPGRPRPAAWCACGLMTR